MSHFFKKIEISFNKEQVEYPDIEWNKDNSTSSGEKDGIEIIREGSQELDLIIKLYINYLPFQFKVKNSSSMVL